MSAIRMLPQVIFAEGELDRIAGEDHPIRSVTRQIAFDAEGWTPERAAKVAQLFDGMAPDWDQRRTADQMQPLLDALARGGPGGGAIQGERCLELGSGTGAGTRILARHFARVHALDIAREMLRRAPAESGARVHGDAARLPFASGSIDVLVHVNAFLFPAEADRVLAASGTLVWVSTRGDGTPIYLPAEDVREALPGQWVGATATAGWGTWCALRREAV